MEKLIDPVRDSEEFNRALIYLFLEDQIAYECFFLRTWGKLSHDEVAKKLSISRDWASKSYMRGRKLIQDYLQIHTAKLIAEVIREIVTETVIEEKKDIDNKFPRVNKGHFVKRKVS